MNSTRKQQILTIFANNPVVSTTQVSRLFTNNQPGKRASAALCELEEERIVEGRNRGLAGLPKVWRLTKKGREVVGVSRPPVPLNNRNVEHWLAICDAWQTLREKGDLLRWMPELREPYAKDKTFCADAFAAVRTPAGVKLFFIEVQLSSITESRWAAKWAVHSEFRDSPAWKKASFQDFKNGKGEPVTINPNQVGILAITTQTKETVTAGSKLPIVTVHDLKSYTL